jgi:diguanylate cyclase (GGDEF)-like protein
MASYFVLIFGCVLLACGCGGLTIVRVCSRRLKGLGWLAGAFGAGSVGTLLLVMNQRVFHLITAISADELVLLGFVLLHISFLELIEGYSLVPRVGILSLMVQVGIGILSAQSLFDDRLRLSLTALLVAVQVGQTAYLLITSSKKGLRAPAWFNIVLLLCFTLFDLFRAAALYFNLKAAMISEATLITYVVYVAVAMGMAFGFFWMTTATLSSMLEQIASTDPLTRLFNRRAFRSWCEMELERSQRRKRPFSLLMVDLDHFKQINDQFGHNTGDVALCAAVEQMQDSIRGIDILGRWGGEEFVVLLPGASMEAALVIAERVRANVGTVTVGESGRLHRIQEVLGNPKDMRHLTVSLGVASYRGKGDKMDEIVKRADEALYSAKANGRNRVLSIA